MLGEESSMPADLLLKCLGGQKTFLGHGYTASHFLTPLAHLLFHFQAPDKRPANVYVTVHQSENKNSF